MDQTPPDPDATVIEKRGHSAERIAALHTDLSSMRAAEPPCRCPETGATMAVAMGGTGPMRALPGPGCAALCTWLPSPTSRPSTPSTR